VLARLTDPAASASMVAAALPVLDDVRQLVGSNARPLRESGA